MHTIVFTNHMVQTMNSSLVILDASRGFTRVVFVGALICTPVSFFVQVEQFGSLDWIRVIVSITFWVFCLLVRYPRFVEDLTDIHEQNLNVEVDVVMHRYHPQDSTRDFGQTPWWAYFLLVVINGVLSYFVYPPTILFIYLLTLLVSHRISFDMF